MLVPEGYDHKATSHSFNGAEKASVYFSKVDNQFAVYIHENHGTGEEGKVLFVSKVQLEILISAGKDVLDDLSVV